MTKAEVDIFEGEVNDKPVAWHEISHDGYRSGFGFWLCDVLLRKDSPKTVSELSKLIWKSGYAYHITPKSNMYDPEIPDPFFNMNMGPFTVGPNSITPFGNNAWNENNDCIYRVIHKSNGSWEIVCASDSKQDKTLVEQWKYEKSPAFKKAKAAKEKKQQEEFKKIRTLGKEATKLVKELAKKNKCKFKDILQSLLRESAADILNL